MKSKLLIIGASGHGKVVADIAMKMKKWNTIAFLDDDENKKSSLGLNVLGPTNNILTYINEWDLFVAIGDNTIRQQIYERLEKMGASIPILIHPTAVIGEEVEIGSGTVLMAGTIINCSTKIGKACIINTSSTIDHDNHIGDYVHVSPGAHLAGTVKVGQGSWLGIGSVVSNNVNITSNCIVGAGSVVLKDIKESGIYVGTPVRRIKDMN